MQKSTFSPQYETFREKLVEMRTKAGLTQRELAKILGREHSFVSRIELGERRLDVVEFYWVARACGVAPDKMAAAIMRDFNRINASKSKPLTRKN